MMGRPSPADPRVAGLESDLRGAQREIAKLREQLAERPASPALAPSLGNGTAGAAANPGGVPTGGAPAPEPNPRGALRDVMALPSMRMMMEQQQAQQIEAGYGRLFEILSLSAEEKNNLRQLLLAREKGQTDFALKMMDPNLTAEQRQQLAQQMQAENSKYDESIKAFMNNANDFNTFKQWEDTQPERVQFDMMGRALFTQSGEPLSAEQEQQLIKVAAEVRKTPNPASEFLNPASMDPTKLTDEAIAGFVQQLKKNDDLVAAKAASFLTPGQLKTLAAYQEQARNMAQTSVKMSAALGGGPGGR